MLRGCPVEGFPFSFENGLIEAPDTRTNDMAAAMFPFSFENGLIEARLLAQRDRRDAAVSVLIRERPH